MPSFVIHKLRQAISKGKFLNKHIKGKYPFEKVTDP
jgi:hypothetical protein